MPFRCLLWIRRIQKYQSLMRRPPWTFFEDAFKVLIQRKDAFKIIFQRKMCYQSSSMVTPFSNTFLMWTKEDLYSESEELINLLYSQNFFKGPLKVYYSGNTCGISSKILSQDPRQKVSEEFRSSSIARRAFKGVLWTLHLVKVQFLLSVILFPRNFRDFLWIESLVKHFYGRAIFLRTIVDDDLWKLWRFFCRLKTL